MKRSILSLASLVLPLLFATACDSGGGTGPDPFVERQIPAELAGDVSTVVESVNRFTLDLYARLRETKDGNLFCSPFSVSTALAMTYAGARGSTESEMRGVLRFAETQENLHPSYGALVRSLDRGSALGGYRLNVANRLWGETGYAFLDVFLGICETDYAAPLEQLAFSTDPEASRETVNAWVEEKTEQRIQDLLPPGSVNTLTRLILTNAIYFKGKLASQFDPRETAQLPFHRPAGAAVVPTMYQREGFGYAHVGDVAVLEMRYEGEDLSMLVLLPDRIDGISDLERALTYENLLALGGAVRGQEVETYLPRFEFTTFSGLKEILSDMGMPSAFRPEEADFSGMTGTRDLFIQDVVHKAFVKVNEEGTEAAAATGVIVGTTSIPDYPVFRADHPFLFLIRDNVTGAVLFMGRVADPLSTG
jgi:serpin B